MVKKVFVCTCLVILLACVAALTDSNDCECANSGTDSRLQELRTNRGESDPEVLEPEVEVLEAMEWKCIVWWTSECVDYTTRPCDSCFIPCSAGCLVVCTGVGYYTNFWWGLACDIGCEAICIAECPQCTYCEDWEYTRHKIMRVGLHGVGISIIDFLRLGRRPC